MNVTEEIHAYLGGCIYEDVQFSADPNKNLELFSVISFLTSLILCYEYILFLVWFLCFMMTITDFSSVVCQILEVMGSGLTPSPLLVLFIFLFRQ